MKRHVKRVVAVVLAVVVTVLVAVVVAVITVLFVVVVVVVIAVFDYCCCLGCMLTLFVVFVLRLLLTIPPYDQTFEQVAQSKDRISGPNLTIA